MLGVAWFTPNSCEGAGKGRAISYGFFLRQVAISFLRTAYRIISAVVCRLSFSMMLER